MSQPPIRWGILGCGDVTEVKSGPAYQQVEGFSLDAVMARTPGKAKDYAQRHGVGTWYEDADALINDPNLNAIYIATPPDSHMHYALRVAEAGKICSLEKPMALSARQCETINQAFTRADIPLFVAYYRRCLPGFLQLKTRLAEQPLGDIRHIDWQYHRPPRAADLSGQPNWRTQSNIAPGGYFDDIACHGLDILLYLFGPVRQASGVHTNQQGLYSASDSVAASLLFESGATATAAWNFAANAHTDRVTVSGSKGLLTFSVFQDTPAHLETDGGSETIQMPKPTPIQLPYVAAMRDTLLNNQPHPSTGLTAIAASQLMDQILASRP